MISAVLMLTLLGDIAAAESDDLKRDMKALELYLQDEKDHKEHCPKIKWEQPNIKIYKVFWNTYMII